MVLLACAAQAVPPPTASTPKKEPVELRLWNIPQKNEPSPIAVAQRRIFDAFCRAHPEIRVRALVPLKIEGPAQEGNEFLAVAGGVAPDVFLLFGRKIGDYNAQGFLYPLNAYLADYQKRLGQPYAGVAAPDAVWELCHNRGKIVAVPGGYYSMALVCDKTAFARAGLSGRYPQDWDELYEFARRLTRNPAKEAGDNPNDPIQYGLGVITGIYAGWHFLQYVWSAGGDVVQSYYRKDGALQKVPPPPLDYRAFGIRLSNESEYNERGARIRADLRQRGLPADYSTYDLEWRLETDKPDAMEALLFFRKIAHQPWLRNGDHEFDLTPAMFQARQACDPATGDKFNLDDPAVQKRIYYGVCRAADTQSGSALFGNYRNAMGIGTMGDANSYDPSQTAFVPFPSRKGVPPAAFIAGHYLGINAAIAPENRLGRRNVQAVRDAAWAFIEFTTGTEAERTTVQTLADSGLAEFIRPSLLESAGYADLLARVPPDQRRLWDNLARYARVEPYSQGFTHVMTRELGLAIEVAFGDRPDPQTGLYSRDLQAKMDEICQNVNTMILGKLPAETVRKRSNIGWVVFAIMAAGLALGARLIVRLAIQAQTRLGDTEGFGVGGNPAARRLYAWFLLIPAIGSIAIWTYYPLARGLLMAFQDFRILGGSEFVGLKNFVAVVSEPKFWRYMLQTAQYMIMLVGLGFGAPIVLAIMLTEIPRWRVLFRTVYYLPALTTGLVTLFLWKNLLYDSTPQGVLNQLMRWFNTWPVGLAAAVKLGTLAAGVCMAFGFFNQACQDCNSTRARWLSGLLGALVTGLIVTVFASLYHAGGFAAIGQAFITPFNFQVQGFLRDPSLAMLWVIVPVIWAGAGPGCLIYLAALKGIPDEQYEAADLDGAGFWQKIVNVTYPNLKALIIINFVGAVVAGFKESGNIFVMTGGGPEDATMTTGLYIWYNAFMFLNFGLATAMAWIMGALLIGFTLTQLRILNKLQFQNVAVQEKAAEGRG